MRCWLRGHSVAFYSPRQSGVRFPRRSLRKAVPGSKEAALKRSSNGNENKSAATIRHEDTISTAYFPYRDNVSEAVHRRNLRLELL